MKKPKGIIVCHGDKEHQFGDYCPDCIRTIIDNPYGKMALRKQAEGILILAEESEKCGDQFGTFYSLIKELIKLDLLEVNEN
jgi:hypothetical protein